MKITDNIKTVQGISDKRAALYKKLGVESVGDLLTHYPRGYIDFTAPVEISACEVGEYCVICAIVKKKLSPYIGSRIPVYKLILTDESEEILCTFFNSEFSYNKLILNKEYIFYGKINGRPPRPYGTPLLGGELKEIVNPLFILTDDPNKLLPRYRLTAGLSHAIVSANVKNAFRLIENTMFSDLPCEILEEYSLMPVGQAVKNIHFPTSMEEYRSAKRSLVFKELLVLQLGMAIIRSRNRKLTGTPMKDYDISPLYKTLPFKPTKAQVRSVNECIADMKKRVPMNRLLQGDVGSGKTLVAAALAYYAHLNGFQTALMVPTEILAKQHYKTLNGFLEPLGIKCTLIIGGLKAGEKKQVYSEVMSGEASVIVGTHALIQKGVVFNSLGLVVTDEQHRFGVGQRSELISKGHNPHTLVMSATPIPRTLGLIIYGDLDISLLDEMPKGRKPIMTYGVGTDYRERLYRFIIKQINEGRQAYIVCPLIDEGVSEKTSAVKYYNELKEEWFGDIEIGLLHGRMKQSEKDEVMGLFKSGSIKVLVSTTVIEVGVDVPNATVMLIENAEQFGLSQLHQLRGRVGRGEEQSYCVLVTDSKSPYTKARVDTMTRTCDGFEIAGEDLKLRGPGDFFGSKQHGLPMLKIADMTEDNDVIIETQDLARSIIKNDPDLRQSAELRELVAELFKDSNEYGYN
ncbi:MAG: ATP-dependent DNA helicase RecG [Oscillospiraceae bacterium]|nr:ATP-dependent DNA helicase RecG [Oscillospiraceae bacterium]